MLLRFRGRRAPKRFFPPRILSQLLCNSAIGARTYIRNRNIEFRKLRLSVAGVMPVNALRKQAFAAALAAARESGATSFGPHPGTETVLAFPRSLGWLIRAFHKTGESLAGPKAVTVGASPALSTQLPHLSLFAVELTKISNGFGNAPGQTRSASNC